MASISFNNIDKRFGKTQILNRIGFDIADGDFVVLVGPSGCGKSTLLRMLAGLEEIDGGEIRIDGRVINDLDSKDRDIAMVFQSYALYPHMAVRDNMAFSLKLRKAPQNPIDQHVDNAARSLNLVPLLDRFPRELSGGQRQRVAMGRAIVRDPKAFLFDEPLSNLDAKLVEPSGSETEVVVAIGGQKLVAVLPGALTPVRTQRSVDVNPSYAHVFDQTTGARLNWGVCA